MKFQVIKCALVLSLCLLFLKVNSQNNDSLNLREKYPFGVSGNLIMPSPLSLSIDYFVERNLSFEAGLGLMGYYFGTKIFLGEKHWKGMPYLGFTYSKIIFGSDTYSFLYTPIGYQYITNRGFNIAFEVGWVSTQSLKYSFYPGIRIGKRYDLSKKKKEK